MRFVIYKNSILATFCSMFGAALIAMGVFTLVNDFSLDNLLIAVPAVAIGLGIMWLGSFISARKAKRKQAKTAQAAAAARTATSNSAASNAGYAQPRQAAQTTRASAYTSQSSYTAQASAYTAQAATVYPSAAPAVQGKPVKKSAVFAGIFFLLASFPEFGTICIRYTRGSYLLLNSEEVALVGMSLLLMIAALRTKHIQRVSVLFAIGFLGLTLGSVDVALLAYRAYGSGGYVTSGSVYYAAPALKAAAYFLMGIFALLSTRKIKERCGGIVRWIWFVPILPLILAYTKEIADNEALWDLIQAISRHGFMGLKLLVQPVLLHVYSMVFLALAVFLAGFCFQRLCRKPAVVYAQPEPQPVYTSPVHGDNFVMRDAAAKNNAISAAAKPAPAQPAQVACPHCHQLNAAGSQFCLNCGQRMVTKKQQVIQPQVAPPR